MLKKFRKTKVELPKSPEPRQLEEIQAAYQEVRSKLGDSQYLAYLYQQEVEQLSQVMLNLNQEGAKRKELDAQAKQEEAAKATGEEHVES